ncbi:MAG: endonuclease III [Elusimicrobiota bacterium]
MVRAERARNIVSGLRKLYPEAKCELDYSNAHELLFATVLSAQCTDVRVNKVTKTLFQRYKTVADYADADPLVLEAIIHSCGFYRSKAQSIIAAARALRDDFGGEVPAEMDQLLTLRGVARKTANVVLGNAFGKAEGVVVDTHMKRLAYRMGLTDETDPVAVERDLMACVPKKDWIDFSHAMIWHGRRVCKAARAACDSCALRAHCPQRGLDAD